MALMEEELPREGRAGSGMPETSESQSLWRNPSFLALLGVFAVAWAVWAWVGSRHRYPNVFPDELLYGKLSQNLAAGNGLEWRGANGGLPPLWPGLPFVGWHFGSGPDTR